MERENKILTYGFFLRFAKQNYIPCPKCQERLHEILMSHKWTLLSPLMVELLYIPKNIKIHTFYISFGLKFLSIHGDASPSYGTPTWTPCDACQKYLLKTIRESEFILGNKDYTDPPVELWRKWKPK